MLLNQIMPDTAEVRAGASNGDDVYISHSEEQGPILSCSIFLTNSSEMTKSPEKNPQYPGL